MLCPPECCEVMSRQYFLHHRSLATGYAGHLNSSLLAEAITSCLEELSEPLVTGQLSGDLLAHLSAVSVGSVKMYVVKCLLEQLPELQYGMLLVPAAAARLATQLKQQSTTLLPTWQSKLLCLRPWHYVQNSEC